MLVATVRDFKARATKYLAGRDEVVITRRGHPVAVLTPVEEKSPGRLLLELRAVLQEAGVSEREALKALEEARRETYGPRRP